MTDDRPGAMLDAPLTGPACWRAADLASDTSWRHRLTDAERAEILRIARLPSPPPGPEDRRRLAPHLEARLDRVADELRRGRGLFLLTGWPIEEMNRPEIERGYVWFGEALGTLKSQNVAGDLIGEVMDVGQDYAIDPNARGYMSNDELRPHSDGCDLSSLLCLRSAKSGGTTSLVSTGTIHNILRETRPDLLPLLYRGFYNDLRGYGEKGTGRETSPTRWPVFLYHEGHLSSGYNGKTIRTAPAKNRIALSAREIEAIDLLERYAEDDALRVDLRLAPGELVVFSNLLTLHKRDRFEDHPEPERRRLLLRLWLNDHEPRPLPEAVATLLRGGISARRTSPA
ncbi:MAG: TauD/TfdA family dioxygenase [Alphaproteobacteria bacterium]|nr:TauD/TfdA family dioxygenase [Alphaproteobacteria bacterium]